MITEFRGQYRFLSNFSPYPVTYKIPCMMAQVEWPTAEHAYQASKCELASEAQRIYQAAEPRDAKRLGRQAQLRDDWAQIKKHVMLGILLAKFTQGSLTSVPTAGSLLVATGSQLLIEGNTWHDNYWGQCSCLRCNRERSDSEMYVLFGISHPGHNYLGRLLMAVRDVITPD
jgi:ribA/ribD-fused uncharacterized protein